MIRRAEVVNGRTDYLSALSLHPGSVGYYFMSKRLCAVGNFRASHRTGHASAYACIICLLHWH